MVSTLQTVPNQTTLCKIESFMNEPSYREVLENSANYNTRLCIERRLRMPFLDSQTGVAQNHSNLFMSQRQRIPGLNEGQIYTYPSKRWRKKRRQYLMNFLLPRRKEIDSEGDLHTISTVENPAASEDSKDSVGLKDDNTKDAWYYDDLDMQDMEPFDDQDPDSDYDYEESYSKRKKKRGSKVARNTDSPAAKKPKGPGRGRKKANYDALTDAEKPFSCELCGARYKTRPGLTYHYTHSHKDRGDDEDSSTMMSTDLGGSSIGGTSGGSGGSLPPSQPPPQQGTGPSPTQQQQPPQGPPVVVPGNQQPPPGPPPGQGPPPQGPPPHLGHAHHPPSSGPGPMALGPMDGAPGWSQHQTFLNAPGSGGSRRGRQSSAAAQAAAHAAAMAAHAAAHQAHHAQQAHHAAAAAAAHQQSAPPPPQLAPPPMLPTHMDDQAPPMTMPILEKEKVIPSCNPATPGILEDKERAAPSPYCDFCLGDANENKKTGMSEELVSCSDCGRSGHPSCLQFTPNMIISVRKYRWQCIECKCCSICGTSDNDDQLLFCDDCDRGYHMYCLNPPLSTPPEGSWSCRLCLHEFHNK